MRHWFQNKKFLQIGILGIILVGGIGIAMTWMVLSLSLVFQLGHDNPSSNQRSVSPDAEYSAASSNSNSQSGFAGINPAGNQNNMKTETTGSASDSMNTNEDSIESGAEPGDSPAGGMGNYPGDNAGYRQNTGAGNRPGASPNDNHYPWGDGPRNHSSDSDEPPPRISSQDVAPAEDSQDDSDISDDANPSDNSTDHSIPADSDSVGISMKANTDVLPSPGETFEVEVDLDKVKNLGGFQFDIEYDPNVLSISDGAGGVLGTAMEDTGRNVTLLGPKVDGGKVTVGGFSFGDQPGFSGSGNIVKLYFKVKNKGDAALSINNVTLTDTTAKSLKVGNTQNSGLSLH